MRGSSVRMSAMLERMVEQMEELRVVDSEC